MIGWLVAIFWEAAVVILIVGLVAAIAIAANSTFLFYRAFFRWIGRLADLALLAPFAERLGWFFLSKLRTWKTSGRWG